MMTTSRGFLDSFIEDNASTPVEETVGLLECVEEYINEENDKDITIGEWAFLTEMEDGELTDYQFQLLDEVFDEIEVGLLEADELLEGFTEDDDDVYLEEAVKTTIKRLAKVAKKKPLKAAKMAGKRLAHVGMKAVNRLKAAAASALDKAKSYKARAAAAVKGSAAYKKAAELASKWAQKAKDLKNRVTAAIKNAKYRRELIKKRKKGMPVQ